MGWVIYGMLTLGAALVILVPASIWGPGSTGRRRRYFALAFAGSLAVSSVMWLIWGDAASQWAFPALLIATSAAASVAAGIHEDRQSAESVEAGNDQPA